MHVTMFRFASARVGRVSFYLHPERGVTADVAQLVEHHLAKVRVAGSSPVIRSEEPGAPSPSISWWVGREVRHRPAKPFTPVRIRYPPRAIGAAGARFPDTEEVTGSIPVSPTVILVTGSAGFSPAAHAVHADVAQLVEHHLAKVRVAGSSPVIRSGDWRSGSALP